MMNLRNCFMTLLACMCFGALYGVNEGQKGVYYKAPRPGHGPIEMAAPSELVRTGIAAPPAIMRNGCTNIAALCDRGDHKDKHSLSDLPKRPRTR